MRNNYSTVIYHDVMRIDVHSAKYLVLDKPLR